ncbi:MAG: DUF447 family protein [Isosphaeraceae bacterium]
MILEGLVTTLGIDGQLNIAPMGPNVATGMDRFVLRPFVSSTTFANLAAREEGVFHVMDDVLLLAQTAIGQAVAPATREATRVRGRILSDACRYYEFRVQSIDATDQRAMILVETVASGRIRDFLGFNRARHAVVEAAILATRVGLIEPDTILDEFRRLEPLVDKTGGSQEREAFDLLTNHVREAATRLRPVPDRPEA